MSLSNNPPIILELKPELADFIIENCDANIALGLNAIQDTTLSRATIEKLIEQIENFKQLKAAIEKAK